MENRYYYTTKIRLINACGIFSSGLTEHEMVLVCYVDLLQSAPSNADKGTFKIFMVVKSIECSDSAEYDLTMYRA